MNLRFIATTIYSLKNFSCAVVAFALGELLLD